MKKKLLLFIPLLLLTGCGNQKDVFIPYFEYANGEILCHLNSSEHKTYLMLSSFGNIEGMEKEDVPSEFIEYTVTYLASPGSDLPGYGVAPKVTSSVKNAAFRGWALYDPKGKTVTPNYYVSVPAESNGHLIAIFDGVIGPQSDPIMPQKPTNGFGLMLTNGDFYVGEKTGDFDGFQQYLISNASFKSGQEFTLYDFKNEVGWIVNIDPWSFGGTDLTPTYNQYLDSSNNKYKVIKNFKADIYIKIKDGQDQIYFGLK